MTPTSVKQKASSLDTSTKTSPSAGLNGIAIARPNNRTGLPDSLKTGIESLSGISMDDVWVHTNSSKPAQLQALAYTQGTDIHIGPGQERHLPHEAWHVVQQKQARVKPTMQLKGRTINDDKGLEQEADRMGARASRSAETSMNRHDTGCSCNCCGGKTTKTIRNVGETVQRKITLDGKEADVNTALAAVLKKDNTIPGTIEELKEALQELISDQTDRTTPEKLAEDLQAKMVGTYPEAKNIANVKLRLKFPEKVFLNTASAEELAAFTKDEILDEEGVGAEIGYLIDPKTGLAVGAGLGAARFIQTHEVSADGKDDKWAGSIMTHSHPSGSPPTIPNDITTAVKRKATETIVQTRNFKFGLKIDYTKSLIAKNDIWPLMSALGTSDRKADWASEAKAAGYDEFVYDPDSLKNTEEKNLLKAELVDKTKSNDPDKWTMDLDYGMSKFVGYKKVEEDFASQGLTVTSTATKSAYLADRLGFYKRKGT